MGNIKIDIVGTIHIRGIFKDKDLKERVSLEEEDLILEELRDEDLLFILSSKTIVDVVDKTPIYWCTIHAGNDVEYQFWNFDENEDN